jgi:hypothetical protein
MYHADAGSSAPLRPSIISGTSEFTASTVTTSWIEASNAREVCMKILNAILSAIVAAGFCTAQQAPSPHPDHVAQESMNVKGVYGKIKDVKTGDKIVIAVDKGKDRTYSLADPKKTVSIAEGLSVGDKVKIIESGKGDKSVQIVRDVRDNAGQGGQRARTTDQQ